MIGVVAAEVVASLYEDSPVPAWSAHLFPLTWPRAECVVWWLGVATAAGTFRRALGAIGIPQHRIVVVVSVLPFVVFAGGIATGAGWSTLALMPEPDRTRNGRLASSSGLLPGDIIDRRGRPRQLHSMPRRRRRQGGMIAYRIAAHAHDLAKPVGVPPRLYWVPSPPERGGFRLPQQGEALFLRPDNPTLSVRGLRRLAGSVLAFVLAGALVAPLARSAAADQLASTRAQAAQITAQLHADGVELDRTASQFGQAQQHLAQLDSEITRIDAAIARSQSEVSATRARLRAVAVKAYVDGGASAISTILSSNVAQAGVTQVYESAVGNELTNVEDGYRLAEASLASQQQQLRNTRAQAQGAVNAAAAARQAAQRAQASQQAELSQMNGQIAVLVRRQQQAEQDAAHAAFLARVQAEQAAALARSQAEQLSQASGQSPFGAGSSATPPAAPGGPPAPGGGAQEAVQAAESQVGVPYQWGGESPGQGFDCSGLTQWSWAQAGVAIPRVAADQYDAIPHVPLSDIEPGDLIFWDDGTNSIQHVAIYIGNGNVVTAPETGERIRIQPIWNNGLVGAGRP